MFNIKETKNQWFQRFPTKNDIRLRLFCFHYAGGGASTFQPWSVAFPSHIEVIAIQLPGRETRYDQPLMTDLQAVIEQLYWAILPLLDLPFVFFGHSLGGGIAFKLIEMLEEHHKLTPIHFITSGRSAPKDNKKHFPKITHLPDDQFIKGVFAYNGTPDQLQYHEELLKIYIPILRADFYLSDQFLGSGTISCPITVFGGKEDQMSEEDLFVWSESTTDFRGVVMFDGGHFFIKDHQFEVLNMVRSILLESPELSPHVGHNFGRKAV